MVTFTPPQDTQPAGGTAYSAARPCYSGIHEVRRTVTPLGYRERRVAGISRLWERRRLALCYDRPPSEADITATTRAAAFDEAGRRRSASRRPDYAPGGNYQSAQCGATPQFTPNHLRHSSDAHHSCRLSLEVSPPPVRPTRLPAEVLTEKGRRPGPPVGLPDRGVGRTALQLHAARTPGGRDRADLRSDAAAADRRQSLRQTNVNYR